EGALESIISVYKDKVLSKGLYLTDRSTKTILNIELYQEMLQSVAAMQEVGFLTDQLMSIKKEIKNRKNARDVPQPVREWIDTLSEEVNRIDGIPDDKLSKEVRERCDPDEMQAMSRLSFMNEMRRLYYKQKFDQAPWVQADETWLEGECLVRQGLPLGDMEPSHWDAMRTSDRMAQKLEARDFHQSLRRQYVRMTVYVLHYWFRVGVPHWREYFEPRFAPFASDLFLKTEDKAYLTDIDVFEPSSPAPPLAVLLSICPSPSLTAMHKNKVGNLSLSCPDILAGWPSEVTFVSPLAPFHESITISSEHNPPSALVPYVSICAAKYNHFTRQRYPNSASSSLKPPHTHVPLQPPPALDAAIQGLATVGPKEVDDRTALLNRCGNTYLFTTRPITSGVHVDGGRVVPVTDRSVPALFQGDVLPELRSAGVSDRSLVYSLDSPFFDGHYPASYGHADTAGGRAPALYPSGALIAEGTAFPPCATYPVGADATPVTGYAGTDFPKGPEDPLPKLTLCDVSLQLQGKPRIKVNNLNTKYPCHTVRMYPRYNTSVIRDSLGELNMAIDSIDRQRHMAHKLVEAFTVQTGQELRLGSASTVSLGLWPSCVPVRVLSVVCKRGCVVMAPKSRKQKKGKAKVHEEVFPELQQCRDLYDTCRNSCMVYLNSRGVVNNPDDVYVLCVPPSTPYVTKGKANLAFPFIRQSHSLSNGDRAGVETVMNEVVRRISGIKEKYAAEYAERVSYLQGVFAMPLCSFAHMEDIPEGTKAQYGISMCADSEDDECTFSCHPNLPRDPRQVLSQTKGSVVVANLAKGPTPVRVSAISIDKDIPESDPNTTLSERLTGYMRSCSINATTEGPSYSTLANALSSRVRQRHKAMHSSQTEYMPVRTGAQQAGVPLPVFQRMLGPLGIEGPDGEERECGLHLVGFERGHIRVCVGFVTIRDRDLFVSRHCVECIAKYRDRFPTLFRALADQFDKPDRQFPYTRIKSVRLFGQPETREWARGSGYDTAYPLPLPPPSTRAVVGYLDLVTTYVNTFCVRPDRRTYLPPAVSIMDHALIRAVCDTVQTTPLMSLPGITHTPAALSGLGNHCLVHHPPMSQRVNQGSIVAWLHGGNVPHPGRPADVTTVGVVVAATLNDACVAWGRASREGCGLMGTTGEGLAHGYNTLVWAPLSSLLVVGAVSLDQPRKRGQHQQRANRGRGARVCDDLSSSSDDDGYRSRNRSEWDRERQSDRQSIPMGVKKRGKGHGKGERSQSKPCSVPMPVVVKPRPLPTSNAPSASRPLPTPQKKVVVKGGAPLPLPTMGAKPLPTVTAKGPKATAIAAPLPTAQTAHTATAKPLPTPTPAVPATVPTGAAPLPLPVKKEKTKRQIKREREKASKAKRKAAEKAQALPLPVPGAAQTTTSSASGAAPTALPLPVPQGVSTSSAPTALPMPMPLPVPGMAPPTSSNTPAALPLPVPQAAPASVAPAPLPVPLPMPNLPDASSTLFMPGQGVAGQNIALGKGANESIMQFLQF
ncbi:hypothetical protein KIPB_000491, partial [Kipferlia bialata]